MATSDADDTEELGAVVEEETDDVGDASEEPQEARRRRRRRFLLIGAAAVSALVIVALVAAGLYVRNLQTTFDDNRNILDLSLDDDSQDRSEEGTLNILLLGSDSRGEGMDTAETKGEDGERSDTMMFVHIPADRSGVYVMSIVRDLWVDIPGEGEGRINSALDLGGYPLVVDTVEELLDTHIDHIGIIDFTGFEDLTTALGGVYVDNPHSFSAGQHNPTFYPEGTIRLQGNDALRYVRERKSFVQGDFMRVQNQQRVVEAIIDRFLSADTLTNPQRVNDAVEGIVPYLTMDEGLDGATVGGYAVEMRGLRSDDVHMFTIPTGDQMVTSGGAYVLKEDENATEVLRRSLRRENLDGFLTYLDARQEAMDEDSWMSFDEEDEDDQDDGEDEDDQDDGDEQ
ncbi:MAG: LCP family protein [Nesterenkonia sp.]|nr:LCP family protein [Nesterenkonia sp.]